MRRSRESSAEHETETHAPGQRRLPSLMSLKRKISATRRKESGISLKRYLKFIRINIHLSAKSDVSVRWWRSKSLKVMNEIRRIRHWPAKSQNMRMTTD